MSKIPPKIKQLINPPSSSVAANTRSRTSFQSQGTQTNNQSTTSKVLPQKPSPPSDQTVINMAEAKVKELEAELQKQAADHQRIQNEWANEKESLRHSIAEAKTKAEADPDARLERMFLAPLLQEEIKRIPSCDGKCKDSTIQWLREVSDSAQPTDVAHLTSKGQLRSFVKTNKSLDWSELRALITRDFISAHYARQQLEGLQSMVQRAGESTTAYTYEFRQMTAEAGDLAQADPTGLVRNYLSGLRHRSMAERVMAKSPKNLDDAIRLVQEAQAINDSLKPVIKQGKTHSSEVTATDSFDSRLDKMSETINQLSGKFDAMMSQRSTSNQGQGQPSPKANPAAGQECFNCGRKGHFANECRSPKKQAPNQSSNSKSQFKSQPSCLRCRQNSHQTQSCQAAPPRRPCFCGGSHWLFDCPNKQVQQENFTAPRQ